MVRTSPDGQTTEAENVAESAPAEDDKAVNAADPAPAEEEDAKGSLLDAVTAALESEEDQSSGSDKSGDNDSDTPPADEDAADEKAADSKAKGEEEEDSPPFHEHPAWKRVLKQRDEARQELETLGKRAEQFEQSHKVVEQLQGFMQETGTTQQEFDTTLDIVRLVKTNPEQAIAPLENLLSTVKRHIGAELPDDLRQEVSQGYISEARAKELAKTRSENARYEESRKSEAERHQTQLRDGVVSQISAWDRDWQSKDPDYKVLAPYVTAMAERSIRQDGYPKSPAEAVERLTKFREQVKRDMAPAKRPGPSDPLTTNGNSTKSSVSQAPASLMEAIERGARA